MKKAASNHLVYIMMCLFIFSCNQKGKKVNTNAIADSTKIDSAKVEKPCVDSVKTTFLDIEMDSLYVREKEFGRRDNIQKIFSSLKLDKNQLTQFLDETQESFDFKTAPTKLKYFLITKETDSTSRLQYLVFKTSSYEYIIANCTDTSYVSLEQPQETATTKKKIIKKKKTKKPVLFHPLQISFFEKNIDTTEIRFAAVIQKSLSKTLKENNLDQKLIEQLNKAFGNKFSVNSLRKNDTIQFIYDQTSINGQFLDVGHIKAACVRQKKKRLFALDYFLVDDSSYQYVDDKGKYLKTAFLKSPLQKGGSIVSRFNLHRFHPILLVEKAHLGTDFAAPTGAPIVATASGIVEKAEFTQNNGNYVKIRHDRVYETQYLHMCRIGKGMRSGVRVQQGQVIGYVGQTGLATGPHVCYRFWKNGEQVDPLREKLNVIKQIPKEFLESYLHYFDTMKKQLDIIPLKY
ncbi:MAG: M23 family metallopeptidase [Chitinophagales bacterium]